MPILRIGVYLLYLLKTTKTEKNMKTYFITYQEQKSGSCDTEVISCKGGMTSAKKYAKSQESGTWLVKSVKDITK